MRAQQNVTGRFGIMSAARSDAGTCELIARIAPSSASVLIAGESGTGKDVVAKTIHELSRRRHGPFLPVNCGAISPTADRERALRPRARQLHRRRSPRTRATSSAPTGGTLFLDEITEMPIELQVKLLRVLETGTFARVGGDERDRRRRPHHRGDATATSHDAIARGQAARGPATTG